MERKSTAFLNILIQKVRSMSHGSSFIDGQVIKTHILIWKIKVILCWWKGNQRHSGTYWYKRWDLLAMALVLLMDKKSKLIYWYERWCFWIKVLLCWLEVNQRHTLTYWYKKLDLVMFQKCWMKRNECRPGYNYSFGRLGWSLQSRDNRSI